MDTVMELLEAMSLVQRLCRELDFPPVIEKNAAQRVILTAMERGSKEDSAAIMAAFDFADTIQ
jgi:hypothetical protein